MTIMAGCRADPVLGSGMAMAGLLLLALALVGANGEPARTLPRVFQQADLGMRIDELLRRRPDLGKSRRARLATETLTTAPKDPYLQRVTYRFHAGTLYEIEIRYRPERLVGGVSGLLARLKESYGPPTVDRDDELDLDSGDLNRRRTVWEDGRTRITLLEREYLRGGDQQTEVTLAMTDLALKRLRDVAQQEQIRRKMQEIPIPVSDGQGGGTGAG